MISFINKTKLYKIKSNKIYLFLNNSAFFLINADKNKNCQKNTLKLGKENIRLLSIFSEKINDRSLNSQNRTGNSVNAKITLYI